MSELHCRTTRLKAGRLRLFVRWEVLLPDGRVNHFHPAHPLRDAWYRDVVAWAGYTDPIRYAFEHDLTHLWLAERQGRETSQALIDGLEGKTIAEMSPEVAAEEHLVNHLQRYVHTGLLDDEHGCLVAAFGDNLPAAAGELRKLYARAWPRVTNG